MIKNPKITHIQKVEIKGLWDKYNVDWTLNRDVNILIGENGTGKSTILRIIERSFWLDRDDAKDWLPSLLAVRLLANDGLFLMQSRVDTFLKARNLDEEILEKLKYTWKQSLKNNYLLAFENPDASPMHKIKTDIEKYLAESHN